ncbi:MAG: threonine aldolase family protein [Bacillota bacterium]
MIDLRSDTVTQPTEKMRAAMYTAVVGDDILGEDPTVKKLEELAAQIFGKEAGLFVTSGTMANQIAVMVYSRIGDEVIVGKDTHIFNLEVGGLSALSGVQPRPIEVVNGYYDPAVVQANVRPQGVQSPDTCLICIENTYNLNKGLPVTLENIEEVCAVGREYHIPVYMDGARIFNAAAALGIGVQELTGPVDSLQVCLTKGLAAPFGSVLVGSAEFIHKARKMKQRIGGGMRQAGIMAAAGIVALEEMVHRLPEDHHRAKTLAKMLLEVDQDLLNIKDVQTNIIAIDIAHWGVDGDIFVKELLARGIKIKKIGRTAFRLVTHCQIREEDLPVVAQAVAEVQEQFRKTS